MRAKEFDNPKEKFVDMFRKFLPLAMEVIGLRSLPTFEFENNLDTGSQPSFGMYSVDNKTLYIALANRHPNDILRTIAHELVHYKQDTEHELNDESGATGSPEENEANQVAGIVMRNFNKRYPEFLKSKPVVNESAGDRGDIPTGPQQQLIPFPKGTTMVDVSDVYDWYKLGMVISDLDDADPKIFGQGAPHTVIAFGSEEEEHKLLPLLKRLGLSVHDIDRPEDVKKVIPAKMLAKDLAETIRKVGRQYRLVSKSGKNLGTYPTHAGAEKREQQVQYFKHVGEAGNTTQYVAALYIDEFADGDHWYVKGTPDMIQRFVQLANSLEDEVVKGTEYEPGVGMMANIHKDLGDDSIPQWKIVPATNLEQIKPITGASLRALMTADLSDGVGEFMSDFLWNLEEKGQALVHDGSEQSVSESFDKEAGAWRDWQIANLDRKMKMLSRLVKGWVPSEEDHIEAIEAGYDAMKETGDVKDAAKAIADTLKEIQRRQGMVESDDHPKSFTNNGLTWTLEHLGSIDGKDLGAGGLIDIFKGYQDINSKGKFRWFIRGQRTGVLRPVSSEHTAIRKFLHPNVANNDEYKKFTEQGKVIGYKQGVTEGSYREGGSITHDGVEYDFDRVMSIAEKLPTKTCSVDRLSWILKYDTPNKERLERADITVPLIVTKSSNGKLAAIDGLHRLAKAVRDNVKTLPVKYVSPKMLPSAKISKQGVAESIIESTEILTEEMLREAFLQSLQQKFGAAIQQPIKTVIDVKTALGVLYKVASNQQYLDTATFELKRALKRQVSQIKNLKLQQTINSKWPQGRTLGDFFKALILYAISKSASVATNLTTDQAADFIINQVVNIEQLVGNVIATAGGSILSVLKGLKIADTLFFEILTYINNKIINIPIQPVSENFADGRNPQDKGDSARHGIRKGMSLAQLKKVRSSDSASPRKKQLAHWQINMRQGRKK